MHPALRAFGVLVIPTIFIIANLGVLFGGYAPSGWLRAWFIIATACLLGDIAFRIRDLKRLK